MQPICTYEPRCSLCIHIPHYPHPNPDPNTNLIPNPKPKSYPNLKLFNEYAGDIRIAGYQNKQNWKR